MKTKLDKKHAFLAILVAVVMLSAFVSMASALNTWHFWDDAYPGIPANDGLTHKLDANMTRLSYGDGSLYVNLTDDEAAWWYAMQIVGGEEGIAFEEKPWEGEFYCNIPEDDVPTAGIVYFEVYSVAEADGALERRLAHGSVTVEEIIAWNMGPGAGYYWIKCPDDPLTSQIVPPDCKVAVRVRYVGDGTFGLGYNGPTGEAGETPTRIVAPTILWSPSPPPGTGTPGYWKNHPEAWPVKEITIGNVTYTKDEAIANMSKSEKGDKTYTMFRALVAAKLNVMVGNDNSCIADTIEDADEWMATNGPIGSGVKAGGKKSPWRDGEPLYEELDDYNNGDLPCAKSRDVL
jgi:hypothetical protein